MKRLAGSFALMAALTALATMPAAATEYTIWHNPRDLVPAVSGVDVSYGSPGPSSVISFTSTGTRWVQLPLTVPSTVTVTGVRLCYKVSNSASPLSQIRINEMTTPDAATVRMDDPTDRTSTTSECVVASAPFPFAAGGTLTLLLRIDVTNIAHTVKIGGVGIVVDDGVGAAPQSLTSGE